MILRLMIPFLYLLLLGSVWSAWFKKKFSSSLEQAYMLHILLVLICGMVFKHLSIGIFGGIALAILLSDFLIDFWSDISGGDENDSSGIHPEFLSRASEYDYIYFGRWNGAFMEKYAIAVEDPSK